MIRRLACATLIALLPGAVLAQVRKPGQERPLRVPLNVDTLRNRPGIRPIQPPRTARDSAAARDSVAMAWSPPDSIMSALLERPGYSVTRYEGDVVTFDALTKAFAVAAEALKHAQVEREGQRVITDSTIVYTDKNRHVIVSGHFQIMPGEGQPPIAGSGTADYNLAERSGRLTHATVTVEESGERWFINSEVGKTLQGDSTRGIPMRFYGLGGSLTSCDDSIPDYHFELREIKRTDRTLIARPAVLYIRDVPVMWLPFVFQDIRSGRRSGILPLRFGTSDIVRNNPNYRRHIENLGYYWAMNDYMDAMAWLDWRSAAGGDSTDPGWYKVSAEWKYTWMRRFLQGGLSTSFQRQRNGLENLAVNWTHSERFGRNRNLNVNANYVTSTQLQRQNTFSPYQALATITSMFAYSDKLGPASLQLGGTRRQYPGRQQIDQTFPTMSLTTGSLNLRPWLVWTPSFSYNQSDALHIDQPTLFNTVPVTDASGRIIRQDSIVKNRFARTITFDTPLRIFGLDFRNGVRISEQLNDYPNQLIVYPGADSARRETRIYRSEYRTDIEWDPSFTLPPLFQNRFRITPGVSLANVGGPFWVRDNASGGKFVHGSKRLVYSLSAAPAIFGLWPGFGPFQRFRHSISPTLSYSIAPAANISDEYLTAIGSYRQGYLGALPQSAVSFGLSTNIEGKVRSDGDSTQQQNANKLKLLSAQFSSFSYDFERARATGKRLTGLTTENFNARFTSDLLPGMDIAMDYSLFQGSTQSDSAVFSPFLTRVASTFRISQNENPFAVITRLFGKAVPDQSPAPQTPLNATPQESAMTRQFASNPVAGQASRGSQFVVPPSRGWEAQFSFSTNRMRPPSGGTVIQFDPRVRCEALKDVNPFAYDECLRTPSNDLPIPSTTAGGPVVQMPAQTSLSSSLNLELTQKWAASWQTSYDFEQKQFAAHQVSLQRDLHDWRAIFAFTQSPNGNFAFNFFIALKPQPDLKFDYSRASVRGR